jgi:hypothetical protein
MNTLKATVTAGYAGLDGREPSAAELAAIECERPLIEAELAVVDAEIAIIRAGDGAGELAWRRLRRAQHQVLRTVAVLAQTNIATVGERAA